MVESKLRFHSDWRLFEIQLISGQLKNTFQRMILNRVMRYFNQIECKPDRCGTLYCTHMTSDMASVMKSWK